MNNNPEVIEISSDSSESNGWKSYFPPKNVSTSSVNKKGKGKVESSSANKKGKAMVEPSSDSSFFDDSWVSSYHSTSEEDHAVSKKTTSGQVESKLVLGGNQSWKQQQPSAYASYHVNTEPVADVPYEGRIKVLGLPNKHTWEVIEGQKWKRIYRPTPGKK